MATWSAKFQQLAQLAEQLAAEGSRLKKRDAIAAAILEVETASPGGTDAGLFALYLAGLPFAEADGRKLNAGGALLTKTLLAVSGATDATLSVAYRRHGDLGAAAFDLLAGRPVVEAGLTLDEVAEVFAGMAVAATTAVRAGLVAGMLRRASPLEVKYLLKLMLGDMRIGVKQSLVEEAIALAASAPVRELRHAVMLEADLAVAVRRAFAGTLGDARMRLFHPLGFMLASPVDSPEEAMDRFTEKPAKPAAERKISDEKKKLTKKKTAKGRKGKLAAEAFVEDAASAPDAIPDQDAGSAQDALEDVPELDASMGSARELSDFATRTDQIEAPFALQADAFEADASQAIAIQAFLEDKYDGMRAQVHCGDPAQPGRVAIYSRNREEVTESFPELREAFAEVAAPWSGPLILDGEILGWDFEAGRALPFAVLGQRIGRKRVSNEWRQQVPVVFMAFDLMYASGELLLELPLRERRNRLERVMEALVERVVSPILADPYLVDPSHRDHGTQGKQGVMFAGEAGRGLERLMISPSRLVESAEDIDRAYAEARARANEGVMIKAAGSSYQPGRRGLAWVKLKRELATLDVVITGAEYGHGRRAGLLSDYTFAVRAGGGEVSGGGLGQSLGNLRNVGKAYSGVTDAEIAELTESLKAHTLEDHGHFRTVEPLIVLEVAFNNIMRSDRHASGFALRFPRIIRIRTDKPVSEIDTVERVEEIYQSQVDKPVDGDTPADADFIG